MTWRFGQTAAVVFGGIVVSSVLLGSAAASAVEQGPTVVPLTCELVTESGVVVALQPVKPSLSLAATITVNVREGFLGPTDDIDLGPVIDAVTDIVPATQAAIDGQYPGLTAAVLPESSNQSRLEVANLDSDAMTSPVSFLPDGPNVSPQPDGTVRTSGVVALDSLLFSDGDNSLMLSEISFPVALVDTDGESSDSGIVTCAPTGGVPAVIATYSVPTSPITTAPTDDVVVIGQTQGEPHPELARTGSEAVPVWLAVSLTTLGAGAVALAATQRTKRKVASR